MMRIPGVTLLAILMITALSCSPGNGSSKGRPVVPAKPKRITSMLEPAAALTIPLGEEIRLKLAIPDSVVVDSVRVFLGGNLKRTIPGSSGEPNGTLEFIITQKEGLPENRDFVSGSSLQGGKVRTIAGKLPFFPMWCLWSTPTRW